MLRWIVLAQYFFLLFAERCGEGLHCSWTGKLTGDRWRNGGPWAISGLWKELKSEVSTEDLACGSAGEMFRVTDLGAWGSGLG
jgi:hypothetical protein